VSVDAARVEVLLHARQQIDDLRVGVRNPNMRNRIRRIRHDLDKLVCEEVNPDVSIAASVEQEALT
jgi:hypothetical protein